MLPSGVAAAAQRLDGTRLQVCWSFDLARQRGQSVAQLGGQGFVVVHGLAPGSREDQRARNACRARESWLFEVPTSMPSRSAIS